MKSGEEWVLGTHQNGVCTSLKPSYEDQTPSHGKRGASTKYRLSAVKTQNVKSKQAFFWVYEKKKK
jgi:hypothetical protein